jgi:hypothetical protein
MGREWGYGFRIKHIDPDGNWRNIDNRFTSQNGERVPVPCQITIDTAFSGGITRFSEGRGDAQISTADLDTLHFS